MDWAKLTNRASRIAKVLKKKKRSKITRKSEAVEDT
jgi:hypothetical protein